MNDYTFTLAELSPEGILTVPATTVADEGAERIDLYWNIDRALYDGKSEAGMSSRMPEADG